MPQVTNSAQVDQLSIVVQMKANTAPSIQFLISYSFLLITLAGLIRSPASAYLRKG